MISLRKAAILFFSFSLVAGACSLEGDFGLAPESSSTGSGASGGGLSGAGTAGSGGSGDGGAAGSGGAQASCFDGIQNGDETDVDCGGGCKCATGQPCETPGQCGSGVCIGGNCQAPSCSDGVANGMETAIDCGGACPGCPDGGPCARDGDCASLVCHVAICQAPTCNDEHRNGDETGIDCGGGCERCPDGEPCIVDDDCASGICDVLTCVPATCVDGVENGTETDLDCGGAVCAPCPDGGTCLVAADCASHVCAANVCQVPSCTDGKKNGGESDVDCGGACDACPAGDACQVPADCTSLVCLGGTCQPPACLDGVKNGAESDTDCGGTTCAPCDNGATCGADLDCASGDCAGGACKLWSKRFGGVGDDAAVAVGFDQAGNIGYAGTLSGTVDFGCGNLSGVSDIVIAKLGPSGSCLWSKAFGTALPYERPRHLGFDAAGNMIVAGEFAGPIDFGGGPIGAGNGSLKIFVLKLDPSGNHLFSKVFTSGTAGAAEFVLGMAVHASGDIGIGGYFTGASISFGGPSFPNAGGFSPDIYVAKLDPNGNHIWSRGFGTSAQESVWGLAMNAGGDVFVTGAYAGSGLDWGQGPLPSTGGGDMFVAKLAGATGATAWAKGFGNGNSTIGNGIAVHGTGANQRVAVTGWASAVDLGCGATPLIGSREAIVASFTASAGDCVWSRAFTSTGADDGNAVTMDAAGDVLATGVHRGDINFGGGTVLYAQGPDPNAGDVFLVKLASADGSYLASRAYGGPGHDAGLAVAFHVGSRNVLLAGTFQQTVDFGAGPLTSANGADAFLVSLGPLP